MITPIGNRLLVKPLHQDEEARKVILAMRSEGQDDYVRKIANEMAGSELITLVHVVPPVAGRVLKVGRPFCSSCRESVERQIREGDVVVYAKTAGQEIEIDRVPHLMMRPDDVLLVWRPDEDV